MTSYLTARYVGSNKLFTANKIYTLEVTNGLFGRIKIVPVHGYEHRQEVGLRHKYRNWSAFREEWVIKEVEKN